MCLYPRIIPNKKYAENKKNKGQVPLVKDLRTLYTPIGCDKCIECRKATARGWTVRLQEELKKHENRKVVTLTFSNEEYTKMRAYTIKKTRRKLIKLEYRKNLLKDYNKIKDRLEQKLYGYKLDNEIAKEGIRHFLKRWRKKYKVSVKHWLVTELGHKGTENIHIHGIIWTHDINEIEKIWQYGWICKGKLVINRFKKGLEYYNYVNSETVSYIVKYISKIDLQHKYYKPKILTSAGIGENYINTLNATNNKFKGENTNETYKTSTGYKLGLPKYYRNKIYNDEEREQLWINLLNKNIRYVNGIKIDISKGEEEYYKILAKAQEDNEKLGYGNHKIIWSRYDYEITRRTMMQDKRNTCLRRGNSRI